MLRYTDQLERFNTVIVLTLNGLYTKMKKRDFIA